MINLKVDDIIPNPNQPRKEFDESELQELQESISIKGILQPITVRVSLQPKKEKGLPANRHI